jgi:hypothetical protein
VLKYGHSGDEAASRLELIAAHRDYRQDRAGRACVSVQINGLERPLLLDASSKERAKELLSHIAFILSPVETAKCPIALRSH